MQDTDNDSLQAHLGRVYSAASPTELTDAYDRWAGRYDRDMMDDLGWGGPAEAAKALEGRIAADAPVLDFGAGTGLVGQALHDLGFRRIAAADLSREMLAHARARGVYETLHQVDAGAPLPFADDAFAAVVAVGVLTQAHAPPEAMREWVRVTRPGGFIVFTLRPDLAEEMGYDPVARDLEREGRWEKAFESPDLEGFRRLQSKPYRVRVYRVR